MLRSLAALASVLSTVLLPSLASAVTIWDGPDVSFSKPAFADPNDPANRDMILPGVVEITRDNTQGIYNYAQEGSFLLTTSPADTLWAFPFNNPLETITATNYAALVFEPWQTAFGGPTAGGPPSTVGQDAVMYIVSQDIYIDITFTAWGETTDGGGSFAYTRSSAPVPEPASGLLVAGGIAVVGWFRARSGTHRR